MRISNLKMFVRTYVRRRNRVLSVRSIWVKPSSTLLSSVSLSKSQKSQNFKNLLGVFEKNIEILNQKMMMMFFKSLILIVLCSLSSSLVTREESPIERAKRVLSRMTVRFIRFYVIRIFLSLSLSLTHTHTHIHTHLSLIHI